MKMKSRKYWIFPGMILRGKIHKFPMKISYFPGMILRGKVHKFPMKISYFPRDDPQGEDTRISHENIIRGKYARIPHGIFSGKRCTILFTGRSSGENTLLSTGRSSVGNAEFPKGTFPAEKRHEFDPQGEDTPISHKTIIRGKHARIYG